MSMLLLNQMFLGCSYIYLHISGRWQAPAAVFPKGPKTKETATRGPEGPESGFNTRVRGPEGPEDELS